ncbi:hypothetical protein Tco_0066723 [Tanacetum coccineum]
MTSEHQDDNVKNYSRTPKSVNNMLPDMDRTEDRVTCTGAVRLVMEEHRTEWGMLIRVKLGRLSATTATVILDEEHHCSYRWTGTMPLLRYVVDAPTSLTLSIGKSIIPNQFYDEAGGKCMIKMKAKACVENKVNLTPPNYSKENFLATFSPQKQLTPEQLFWSQDIVKMKAEALKEQNTRPIKAIDY